MQMYGPRQKSRTLPWASCQIFLEALFVCNNINTNYFYFFKFLREVVWKNSKTKNGPRQGTFAYLQLLLLFLLIRCDVDNWLCRHQSPTSSWNSIARDLKKKYKELHKHQKSATLQVTCIRISSTLFPTLYIIVHAMRLKGFCIPGLYSAAGSFEIIYPI